MGWGAVRGAHPQGSKIDCKKKSSFAPLWSIITPELMVLLSGLNCSVHARDGFMGRMLGLESVGADKHSIWTPENFPSARRRTTGPQASLRLGSAHTTGQTQATKGLAKMRPQMQPPAWVTAGAPHEARISLHIGRQATSI